MEAAFSTYSMSSKEGEGDDDEVALKWAALERLPTYDRLKKGLLTITEGGATEIDIHNLAFPVRKCLLERLAGAAGQDNEKLLLKLKNRLDRVGLKPPTIEVRFENLCVEAQAYVGSRALPTVINFYVNIIQGILNYLHVIPSRKKNLSVLKNVSGVIRPSRMALLLGPPGSGKTTLLLALAGRLDPKLKLSGCVTYNGDTMNEFVPQRSAAYTTQHDVHIAKMTVRETLAFSARCQGVGPRFEMLAELLRREKMSNIVPDPDLDAFMKAVTTKDQEVNIITDYILKMLRLEECADTLVGNEMLRGISGGEKRRLTAGEMLVGPARALFMDEISTGLDSSTTFQIVNSLKQCIHILNKTVVISLLQPAPETYNLFDDIILLSDGQIIYQGPREKVLEFFEYVGFKCPARKNVADFLQEVTSRKDQMQYWALEHQAYKFVTVEEFVDAFQSFQLVRSIDDNLSTEFVKATGYPIALGTRKYGTGTMELFKACFSREYLLLKRNSFVYIFKLIQIAVMAIITVTVFLRTEMHRDSVIDGETFVGALFYSIMITMFNCMPELSLTIEKLPVFYKQRDCLFYPSWAYSLPSWILKTPMTLVEAAVWVFLTYYAIGFDPNVGRLFKQYLLLILVSQMGSALFRFAAAAARNVVVACTFGACALLLLFTLSGYVLSKDSIKNWWIWGYWISPLMYAQSAIVVNEFLGRSWSHIAPNSTESLGIQVLKFRAFFTEAYWYWIGIGALFGFVLLFNFCFTMSLALLNSFDQHQGVVFQKTESTKPDDKVGRDHQKSNYKIGDAHGKDSLHGSIRIEAIDRESRTAKKGMVLPFGPHYITFDEIIYSIDMPQEMKNLGVLEDKLVLLKGLSGAFRPGILTALMGVTGAGKTTLLDVLAGRKTGGYVEGSITISGYPKKQETFARIAGYCEQNDIHSPHVTVYESLLYSTWLRLPTEVNIQTRRIFVEEVMELVELSQLRQALVGLPGVSGLSTEQRKRLTIAVELVANPSIIFMDEPTSGLDARAAAIVMRTVRNTVDTGRTVVCTIHQPSIDIFETFDELFLLKRGGQAIYAGPLGHHSDHLIKYFEAIEGVCKIRDGYNPATWVMEITNSTQEKALGIDFAAIYKSSELYRRNKTAIKELSTPAAGSQDLYFPSKYSQSFLNQIFACSWKQHRSYWQNPSYTAMRLLFTIFVALILGTVFWNLGSKMTRPQDLLNAMGSMYVATLFLGIQNALSVAPVVFIERTVFYRERAAGMYAAFPYAIAHIIIELPYSFLQAAIYGTIVYAMMGFKWTAPKFFWYLFIKYFTVLYYTFLGMMTLALSPNQHVSAIISSAFYAMWNLFSGFIIPRTRTPVWWRWYIWGCPVAWTLYGLVASQFGDIKDKLDTGQTVEEFIREYFGFRHDFLGLVAAMVVGFAALFASVFAISIKKFNFQRR